MKDDFFRFIVCFCAVHEHNQDENLTMPGHANRMKTRLAFVVVVIVVFNHAEGICKHFRCLFERNTVLTQIFPLFVFVPVVYNNHIH